MNNYEKLLPVGSVVTLTGASKALLIIGTLFKDEDGTIYDYMGCPYPEGFIDSEQLLMFNHDKITKLNFIGYINADYQLYRSETLEELKKMNLTDNKEKSKKD